MITDTQAKEIGKKIYCKALSDRRNFAFRQLDIDDDIWEEIFVDIGKEAYKVIKMIDEENHVTSLKK